MYFIAFNVFFYGIGIWNLEKKRYIKGPTQNYTWREREGTITRRHILRWSLKSDFMWGPKYIFTNSQRGYLDPDFKKLHQRLAWSGHSLLFDVFSSKSAISPLKYKLRKLRKYFYILFSAWWRRGNSK